MIDRIQPGFIMPAPSCVVGLGLRELCRKASVELMRQRKMEDL